ncbi:MAG: DUF3568 family protein [Candidatus Omnitrophica bacterium]|nr:DUF3568 family protein [Candidatus Omnitrophota bacterium]
MAKKIVSLVFVSFFVLNLAGCIPLLAGAAGGGGTAVWLSGKLSQEVEGSFDKTIEAAKKALRSMDLEVTKTTVDKNIAQIMSKYTDGKTIWIDVRRISQKRSKVDVRVGVIEGDKEAADKILKKIERYL